MINGLIASILNFKFNHLLQTEIFIYKYNKFGLGEMIQSIESNLLKSFKISQYIYMDFPMQGE